MLEHRQAAPRPPQRVVVLGGNGFLGSRLVARLRDAGVETLALGTADLDLTAADAAARLSALLREGDSVAMLAALTPDRGRDAATLVRNVAMAETLCRAAAVVPPAHLVYLSSDAVYPFGEALVDETSCAAAADMYGAMHRARELMLQASIAAPVAVLRATLLYGAGDPHNSYGPNRFRRMAAEQGRITLFGAGEETRDHVHVADAAALVARVLHHRSAGLLNLASGVSVSFDAAARAVAATVDPPVPVVHTPRQAPVTHRHFDTAALLKAFPGCRFAGLAEGLARPD
ncbi:MAG: NAD(P)-dependent oxidoreductase [Alphaproteobacteria bacterium]